MGVGAGATDPSGCQAAASNRLLPLLGCGDDISWVAERPVKIRCIINEL